ncbi:hypothetical protein CRUP_020324, partial [Coryphaenoides rupestris]
GGVLVHGELPVPRQLLRVQLVEVRRVVVRRSALLVRGGRERGGGLEVAGEQALACRDPSPTPPPSPPQPSLGGVLQDTVVQLLGWGGRGQGLGPAQGRAVRQGVLGSRGTRLRGPVSLLRLELELLLLLLLGVVAGLRVQGGVRRDGGGGVGRGVLAVAEVEAAQVLRRGVDGAVDGALGGVPQAALLRLTQVVGDAGVWRAEAEGVDRRRLLLPAPQLTDSLLLCTRLLVVLVGHESASHGVSTRLSRPWNSSKYGRILKSYLVPLSRSPSTEERSSGELTSCSTQVPPLGRCCRPIGWKK